MHVEVDVGLGLPFFRMVGLPDASVRESRDRVRAAIRNSGFEFPTHRITINLAPADVRKAGLFVRPAYRAWHLDRRRCPHAVRYRTLSGGRASLDGSIHSVRGVCPSPRGRVGEVRPHSSCPPNVAEAAVVAGLRLPPRTLTEAVAILNRPSTEWPAPDQLESRVANRRPRTPCSTCRIFVGSRSRGGRSTAAGGHNLLMVGPAPARQCLPDGFPESCLCRSTKHWNARPSIPLRAR